jgi:hypothetical protein
MLICYLFASKRPGVSYNVMEYHTKSFPYGQVWIGNSGYHNGTVSYIRYAWRLVSSPPGRLVADKSRPRR